MTMIVTWLIELYLNQIGEMRDRGLQAKKKKVELERIQEDFRKLLIQSRVKVGEKLFPSSVCFSIVSFTSEPSLVKLCPAWL